ncbi:MAG: RimJ/RimL family protein N-acetyltransferase [Myxococcota bacterium]|jgi:RimJ/RimL family protein N-acetyltransferase
MQAQLPTGVPVVDWRGRERLTASTLVGRTCSVVPLASASHGDGLHAAFGLDKDDRNWTYLSYGPFASRDAFDAWLQGCEASEDTLFHTVVDPRGEPVGIASFLRIVAGDGVAEIGHIHFSPRLQRTIASTEAVYLMLRHIFATHRYRRAEWKCDSLNAASRRAAARLGFVYEGTFHNACVVKARNRDTAWFAMTDAQWPTVQQTLEAWLDPANFDASGRQRKRLRPVEQPALASTPQVRNL